MVFRITILKIKILAKISSRFTLSLCVHVQSISRDFETPWTVACQAPLSMGFSRQEYGSGLPFPSPGDLPNPGIEPASPALAGGFLTLAPPGCLIFNSHIFQPIIFANFSKEFFYSFLCRAVCTYLFLGI